MNGSPAADAGFAVLQEYVLLYPREVAQQLENGDPDESLALLRSLSTSSRSDLLNRFAAPQLAQLLARLEPDLADEFLAGVDPERIAIALARLDESLQDALLERLPTSHQQELRELMSYEPDSAGRLMDAKVNCFRRTVTAEAALESIRAAKVRRVHNVYIIDDEGMLVGAVPIQDLALAESDTTLGELSKPPVGSVQAVEPREEVLLICEQKKLSSIPVVDHSGKLIGVIRYDALMSAAQEEALEGLQAMVGVSRDEKALSSAWFAVRKRLPWLQINLLTAFLAAAVVGLFEDTIAKVTALAVLLPVVAGQSGNTGAQALAVAIRGLTIKEIRINQWMRLVRKELLAGLLNGCAVALVTAIGVWFWSGSIGLVMVIGCSMIISMVIAGAAGAAIPMILKSFKQDPAQSSSIILTTVTDVVGFFSFLGIATAFMSMLPQG